MIKFNKYAVTDGSNKARVTYSAFKMVSTGEECVTIYAKDFASGRALDLMLGDEYENDTDSQADYFEKGRVRLLKSSPHYAAALARAAANGCAG